MSSKQFISKNHYLPEVYLRSFTDSVSKVRTYRTLVPHESVPEWRSYDPSGIGYYKNMYTYSTAQGFTDEFERWFEREFETPASEPIQKVKTGAQLTPQDWECLIRFAAALDVRTPVRMLEDLSQWDETLPKQIQKVSEETVSLVKSLSPSEKAAIKPVEKNPLFPMKLDKEIKEGASTGKLKTEVLKGRSLWLGITKSILTHSDALKALLRHRWTVLHPANDLTWFTNDCPVIRLNYYREGQYDFKGGWGNKGSEILLPLSPHHLMYTKIGDRYPPRRGTMASPWFTKQVWQMIAENAYRYVFADKAHPIVSKFRPRVISKERFQKEEAHWKNWHEQNSEAEREYV